MWGKNGAKRSFWQDGNLPSAPKMGYEQRMSKSSAKARRTAARLAAVQSLYQLELGDGPARRAVYDLMHLRQDDIEEELVEPDNDLLTAITNGVQDRLSDVDSLIVGAMAEARSLDRAEAILRAILRAGTYELLTDAETPVGVIINDYVNVAHAFFTENEPAKLNGVLDKVAQNLGRGATS